MEAARATTRERALTDVEENLITEVLERCLVELAAAFESLVTVQPVILDLESNPQFAQVAVPSDMVVVVVLDTRIGGEEGEITLCIPFSTLEPSLEAMNGHTLAGERRFADPTAAAEAMAAALQEVPVDLRVQFSPVALTSEEVVNLRIGDIVALDHATDRPLTVLVDDIPLLEAVAGRRRKRLACRIVDTDHQGAS